MSQFPTSPDAKQPFKYEYIYDSPLNAWIKRKHLGYVVYKYTFYRNPTASDISFYIYLHARWDYLKYLWIKHTFEDGSEAWFYVDATASSSDYNTWLGSKLTGHSSCDVEILRLVDPVKPHPVVDLKNQHLNMLIPRSPRPSRGYMESPPDWSQFSQWWQDVISLHTSIHGGAINAWSTSDMARTVWVARKRRDWLKLFNAQVITSGSFTALGPSRTVINLASGDPSTTSSGDIFVSQGTAVYISRITSSDGNSYQLYIPQNSSYYQKFVNVGYSYLVVYILHLSTDTNIVAFFIKGAGVDIAHLRNPNHYDISNDKFVIEKTSELYPTFRSTFDLHDNDNMSLYPFRLEGEPMRQRRYNKVTFSVVESDTGLHTPIARRAAHIKYGFPYLKGLFMPFDVY